MFYIHQLNCVSPQPAFKGDGNDALVAPVNNKLFSIEPRYDDIPPSILRRMGKAVRIGVGAALPLVRSAGRVDGIVIGTANGGMEDCIKFLDQIIQYDEGRLTPTNFVQSSVNAIASQIAFLSANKGYNITHVNRGLSFENAVIDAGMLLKENPGNSYLLGGVEEISSYNYNIDYLNGLYKKEPVSGSLYDANSPGSIAGEGAAMFIVNNEPSEATAAFRAIRILHAADEKEVAEELHHFIGTHLPSGGIDLFLSGESGDNRFAKFHHACEALTGPSATVARFKHMTGEFATASALAVWMACRVLALQYLPDHMIKRKSAETKPFRNILICNNFQGIQHSFMLLEAH